jgi:hypothetical protein
LAVQAHDCGFALATAVLYPEEKPLRVPRLLTMRATCHPGYGRVPG